MKINIKRMEMKWGRDDGKVRRLNSGSSKSMHNDKERERERVASVNDVNANTLQENKKKKQIYCLSR